VAQEGAIKGFYESRLTIEVAIWEKGEAVSKYRGVNSDTSYRELERVTGRTGEYLKRWCDLYEKYSDGRLAVGKRESHSCL